MTGPKKNETRRTRLWKKKWNNEITSTTRL